MAKTWVKKNNMDTDIYQLTIRIVIPTQIVRDNDETHCWKRDDEHIETQRIVK